TTFPRAAPDAAVDLATRYLDAWAAGDHAAMYALVDPELRERYPLDAFAELHAAFGEMARIEDLRAAVGEPRVTALPPAPRSDAFPAPDPTPTPSALASPEADATPTPEPTPAPSVDPDAPLAGPVPALAVPFELSIAS